VIPVSSTISRRRALGACAALTALAVLGSAALAGCGQKGALYLPQKKKSKVPPDANNPAPSESEQAPAAPAPAPASPSAAPEAGAPSVPR
jgi:predicted small lipoprotein YifL